MKNPDTQIVVQASGELETLRVIESLFITHALRKEIAKAKEWVFFHWKKRLQSLSG